MERGAKTVGYDFSSASPLAVRRRQEVFAFCKLGLCPGQHGARKRGCRRASCHDRDKPNSQMSKARHHSKNLPSMYCARGRQPTQLLTVGVPGVACAPLTWLLAAAP